jgi:excisionase family DNA binding protein
MTKAENQAAAKASIDGKLTITVEEVAPLLGISRNSAYEGVASGAIPSLRIGRRILVPVGQLKRLLGETVDS